MKNIFKLIFSLAFVLALLGLGVQAQAAQNLSDISFSVTPKNANALSQWQISFSLPKDATVGHVLISLAGYRPDLSQATLSVSGFSQSGTAQVGKSDANCVSNCDDIRYIFTKPVAAKSGAKITFTLNNVKNSAKVGQTGIGFINVFSSTYPQTDLIFNSGDYYITLLEADSDLLPASATDEGTAKTIKDVLISEKFYQPGATTTKMSEIKDPARVENFTLDYVGKVKIVFKEPLDLTSKEAINYMENLADYLTVDFLYFKVSPEFLGYFNKPLELTFYDLPYVSDPDLIKDNAFIIAKDKIENWHTAIIDNKSQASFIIREAGGYGLIPQLTLNLANNQEISATEKSTVISGKISDPEARLKIFLNSQELKDLVINMDKKNGNFDFSLDLQSGNNLIEVRAESDYGQIPSVSRIVNYRQPGQNVNTNQESLVGISPLYYLLGGLAFLLLVLVIALIYLAKQRK